MDKYSTMYHINISLFLIQSHLIFEIFFSFSEVNLRLNIEGKKEKKIKICIRSFQ